MTSSLKPRLRSAASSASTGCSSMTSWASPRPTTASTRATWCRRPAAWAPPGLGRRSTRPRPMRWQPFWRLASRRPDLGIDPENRELPGGGLELVRPSRRLDQAQLDEELDARRYLVGKLAGNRCAFGRMDFDQRDPCTFAAPAQDGPARGSGVPHPVQAAEREEVAMPVHGERGDHCRAHPAGAAAGNDDDVEREEGDHHALQRDYHLGCVLNPFA